MSAKNVQNLIDIFKQATPDEIAKAKDSYWRYHKMLEAIAQPLDISLRLAAGVFAALSPNNSYLGNLLNARVMLEAYRAGKAIDDFRVNTYNPNKEKAWRMCKGEDVLSVLSGNKVRAFFYNIFEPENENHITVDGHVYWAWFGKRGRVTGKRRQTPDQLQVAPSIGDGLYEEISQAVRIVAQFGGLIGNQAQAVIWQTYRRLHNIQSSRQREMFASDAAIVGLPFDHPLARDGDGR